MAIRKALGADDMYDVDNNLRKSIGESNLEKYKSIKPLLALLDYRVWNETDIEHITSMLSTWDEFIPERRGIARKWLHFFGGISVYLYTFFKTKFLPGEIQGEKVILMSNTYVNSERYSSANQSFLTSCGYKVFFSLCDAIKYGNGDIVKSLKKSLKGNYGNLQPIFIFSDSIAGRKLAKLVRELCLVLLKEECENDISERELEILLNKLEREYNKRKENLKKIINRNKFDMYITVNQYNLRDLLIIHACNEMGIRTVQMEHHTMQFSRINFSVEKPMQRLAFAQEYFLWNEGEKLFHEKVFKYYNLFNENERLQFNTMGNLELCYADAKSMIDKYEMKRRVTYMSSALYDTDLDCEDQVKQVKEWRWSIFNQLKLLKERQNVEIRIRYTPYQEMQFREEEIPVLQKWGFEISESTSQCLMEDICSSMAVMSTTSTVLATARALGRLTFRVEDPAVNYIHVDKKIMDISVEEISEIILNEESSVGQIIETDFFSAKHITL